MSYILEFLAMLALPAIVLAGFYLLLLPSLRQLLDETMKLSAGTSFYLRALALLFSFVLISEALDAGALREGAPWMENILNGGDILAEVMDHLMWIFLIFLIQITILTARFRRPHE